MIYIINTYAGYLEVSLFMARFNVNESEYIACFSISSSNINCMRKVLKKKHQVNLENNSYFLPSILVFFFKLINFLLQMYIDYLMFYIYVKGTLTVVDLAEKSPGWNRLFIITTIIVLPSPFLFLLLSPLLLLILSFLFFLILA